MEAARHPKCHNEGSPAGIDPLPGHHTKIEFVVLKSHARHKDPATTALYVRRPEEQVQAWSGLSLDL